MLFKYRRIFFLNLPICYEILYTTNFYFYEVSENMNTEQFRFRTANILRKISKRISPKKTKGVSFPNIGADKLPKDAPRALVIFSTPGVQRYMEGRFDESDPFFNKHTIYWETVEIVRQLNMHGYIVDYADNRATFEGDWQRYAVIIDGSDNLKHAPAVPSQIRIHYTTYIHWLIWNRAELERIAWFKERTGILVPMNRQLPNILSDEYADYLTYYGTETQANSFSAKSIKHQLNISAVLAPDYRKKDIAKAKNNFLWLGGGGLIHKGLDIVMEAFAHMPDMHLYIAGNLRGEPKFWQWAGQILSKNPNILNLGWMDVGSPAFDDIAQNCIATVYASAAEGGPGSIAQVLHWGLIPIVTKSALVRAETLGHIINGETDRELIDSTAELVRTVANTSESKLRSTSDAVAQFARNTHTRPAYSESLSSFLDIITKR